MAPHLTDTVKTWCGALIFRKRRRVTQEEPSRIELHIAVSYGLNISTAARVSRTASGQ
ncbi:MAG: hypothetical protein ACLRNA_11605 [Gemmiger formicilis]|uniref:hypothetical protein n=1 Tax=Gemmiger formicilis TaxID=745368 RepID=UPI003A3928E5